MPNDMNYRKGSNAYQSGLNARIDYASRQSLKGIARAGRQVYQEMKRRGLHPPITEDELEKAKREFYERQKGNEVDGGIKDPS